MKKRLIHIVTLIRNTRPKKLLNAFIKRDLIKVASRLQMDASPPQNNPSSQVVFILTSAVNIEQDSVNWNVNHTAEVRFSEVLCGINSVRQYFPDAEIFYLDNTKMLPEYEDQLRSEGVKYLNYCKYSLMVASKLIPNKGVPWSLTNLLYLVQFGESLQGKNVFFMNGRYTVSDFTVQVSNNLPKENSLSISFAKSNVHTVFFAITAFNPVQALRLFKCANILSLSGFSVEDIFGVFYRKIKYVEFWGVRGKVNGIYSHKV